ncbi:Nucleolar protein 12 [Dimargaris verticillata]|uniref:Nucleolar protein 12 n=1 Tax=Dimargaris verticillata TaxID=2761393 RepID=A0A9W8EDN9_9FUNG|nr:Nucleolar protein 12 [Dimargaris verticillata]
MTDDSATQQPSLFFTADANADSVDPALASLFNNSVKPVDPTEFETTSSLPADEASQTADQPSSSSANNKRKRAPATPEEEAEKRRRTIFVGNVNVEVIKDKRAEQDLRQLFRQFGPIDSMRFRSVAFSKEIPKRAAFLSQSFHENRNACNAYIVFQNADSVEKATSLSGSMFMDHHLRVDAADTKRQFSRKRAVFVGNLPFTVEDEALWRHFGTYGRVTSVRVVRDAKTNLGKGFAYVEMEDEASAGLALQLNGTPFEGRELRVNVCVNSETYTAKRNVLRQEMAEKTAIKKQRAKQRTDPARSAPKGSRPAQFEGERATKLTGALRRLAGKDKNKARKKK